MRWRRARRSIRDAVSDGVGYINGERGWAHGAMQKLRGAVLSAYTPPSVASFLGLGPRLPAASPRRGRLPAGVWCRHLQQNSLPAEVRVGSSAGPHRIRRVGFFFAFWVLWSHAFVDFFTSDLRGPEGASAISPGCRLGRHNYTSLHLESCTTWMYS